MARYQVINQRVEINGTVRDVGAVLDESVFRPASGVVNNDGYGNRVPELSELESLLLTKHVEKVGN